MFESLFGSGSGSKAAAAAAAAAAAVASGASAPLQVTRASGASTTVTLDSQGDLVTAIAWISSGQVVVTGTRGGDVRFWEANPSSSRGQSAPLFALAPIPARIEALCAPPSAPSLSLLAVSDTAPAEIGTLSVSRILDNLDPVSALAANPVSGSRQVAVGAGAAVRVWEPATPHIAFETTAPLLLPGNARALAWSSDGQTIAAAIGDKGALVWAPPDVSQPALVLETPDAIADLAVRTVTGKSKLVTTDASSGTVRTWSLPLSAPVTILAPAGGFTLFAASADGTTVAAASNGRIKVWTSDQIALNNPGQTITLNAGEILTALALTQDGSHVACAVTHPEKLRYYNVSTSSMTEITGSPANITALACWHDSAGPPVHLSLAVAGRFHSIEPSVTIVSLTDATGAVPPTKVVSADLTSAPGPFGALAFSNDGKTVFAASSNAPFLSRWRSDNGNPLAALSSPSLSKAVTTLSVSATDDRLLSGSTDGHVLIWDLAPATPAPTASIQFPSPVEAAVLSQDGKSFVAATGDSSDTTVRLCMITGANVIPRQLWSSASPGIGVSLVPTSSADPAKVIAAWSDRVSLFTAPVVKISQPKDAPGAALCLDVDAQAKLAAVGHASGQVRLHDLAGSKDPQNLDNHSAAVNAVRFVPSVGKLVTGSDDSKILVWDVAPSPPPAAPLQTINMPGPVLCLAVVDSTSAFAGLDDQSQHVVQRVDLTAATVAPPVATAAGRVSALALLSDDLSATIPARLVVGSDDRTASVWQEAGAAGSAIASPKASSNAPSSGLCAAWVLNDPTHFVTGSDEGVARIWDSANLNNDPVQLDPTKLIPPQPANRINAVAASGNLVIVADLERTLKVWDSTRPLIKPTPA
ncbi:MAG TPA: WD40 repeat domain-containing protein, partial [Isosphaeraceae bacterium]|nr:WD40 repeat domain-containing protein [Isosphaeraceae bacterium]